MQPFALDIGGVDALHQQVLGALGTLLGGGQRRQIIVQMIMFCVVQLVGKVNRLEYGRHQGSF